MFEHPNDIDQRSFQEGRLLCKICEDRLSVEGPYNLVFPEVQLYCIEHFNLLDGKNILMNFIFAQYWRADMLCLWTNCLIWGPYLMPF